ncbi:MAG: sigma-54-dependent Fis family transcriptional regulator [Alteromonadaceae bacterium]|nr:sigma-54-dependent Fis family transcriptional regulator [Alteromonadaceae bacterium]|tara:strand:- start:1056 stop:2507 length:1452 start_codon:yes stop_codon:yes gene_type:complete
MAKFKILIVEDDADLRDALVTTLEVAGHKVLEAGSGEDALVSLGRETVDLVVSDVNMPGISGHQLMAQVHAQHPGVPVMLMTAYGQIDHAVAAIQGGAVDYLVKPFEPRLLLEAIDKSVSGGGRRVDEPVAEDQLSQRLFQLAKKVAASDSTVMICGESGTGKEVLAQYIHRHSPRADGPFVAINCAAIPENMLEAVLFGHEKGAFTGAHASAPGKFEQANGGTILLDEISEMEIGLQAKILRVLQEREVERVGGRKTLKLDVRVLATTNRDLREHVQNGRFREDLYYRLSVFPLQWQPLRVRRGDILPMAEHLLRNHSRKMKLSGIKFEASARDALLRHNWPGNVRELDNAIQRALILQQGQRITADDLCLDAPLGMGSPFSATVTEPTPMNAIPAYAPEDDQQFAPEPSKREEGLHLNESDQSLGRDLRQHEFQIIIDTLRLERGKRKQAAEKLGISPRTLRYKLAQMRDCGIDVDLELTA